MPEPRFKPCMQDQPMLLPPDIGDLVPEGSMPRVVDMVVRSIDRSTLTALCPGGGAPALGLQAVPPARAREGRPRDAHGRDGPQHPQDGLRACGVGLVPPLAHKRWPAATADSVIAGHLFRGF
ncbi:MAG: hypothetical protein Q4C09_06505 [Atopobiaceae bacterium]|nr:hypothetical protein [Atopobiaceae bacterium]